MKIIFFFFICFLLNAQNKFARNVFNYEFIGHSETIISINYENIYFTSKNEKFRSSMRLGLGYSPKHKIGDYNFKGAITIPFVTSLIMGNTHMVQFSMGYTPIFSENFIDTTVNPPFEYRKFQSTIGLSIGYRYFSNGFSGQLYPIYVLSDNPSFSNNWKFGISLGLTW